MSDFRTKLDDLMRAEENDAALEREIMSEVARMMDARAEQRDMFIRRLSGLIVGAPTQPQASVSPQPPPVPLASDAEQWVRDEWMRIRSEAVN